MSKVNLSKYDSSRQYNNMQDSIDDSKDNKLTIGNNTKFINFENKFVIPDRSTLDVYREFLLQFTIQYELPKKYYYRPDLVSYHLYNTVDLAYFVLWCSKCPSVMSFNTPIITVFDPQRMHIYNSILERERESVLENNENIPYITDITLKKILIKE